MKHIFLKLVFSILKNELHNDLPFLPERMKIEKFEKLVTKMNFIMIYHFLPERMKMEKVKKLVSNLHDKTEHAIHIRNLKQALNHGLILKKFIQSD